MGTGAFLVYWKRNKGIASHRLTAQVRSGGIEPEPVRIRLLGGFELSVGSSRTVEENEWRLRKARSLVKLLDLARGHRLHRKQVMAALWPLLDGKTAATTPGVRMRDRREGTGYRASFADHNISWLNLTS